MKIMKIIVLVKQVPDSTEIRVDKVTGTLIRAGVPSIINPDDLAGVEEALKIKRSNWCNSYRSFYGSTSG